MLHVYSHEYFMLKLYSQEDDLAANSLFWHTNLCTFFSYLVWWLPIQKWQGCHNLGTRLSQPWHKVVTTLPQCFFTTLSQPWHNLVFWNCRKVVTRLSEHCRKVVTRLSEHCHKVATMQPCDNLGTTLYFETVARLWQGGGKVVTRLSEHCHKVATMYLVIETVATVTRFKCIIKCQNVYF